MDGRAGRCLVRVTLRAMSVQVPVLEVCDLAARLSAISLLGSEAAARLLPAGELGAVTAPVESFLACVGMAARGVATETELLGDTVAGVADSWLALDDALLARRQQVLAR